MSARSETSQLLQSEPRSEFQWTLSIDSLPGGVCSLPVSGCSLPVGVCSPPVSVYSLPVSGCSLPVGGFSLPVSVCSLPPSPITVESVPSVGHGMEWREPLWRNHLFLLIQGV